MIDFHGGSGYLAPVFHAPGKRIKARVNRAGRAASIVNVHGAKADDGTECALPAEARQRNRKVRIVLKFHSGGARRGLKLVHRQLLDESHAVVAQVPAGIVAIGGANKGATAE